MAGMQHIHPLAGMIQSWNKFCFTGGYIEVSVSLPASPNIPG
jgi:beta-glucanase (GH16 family)